MIPYVRDDHVLQVPGQEPSTSFKYGHKDRGFLAHFQSLWRAEIWHTSQESHIIIIHDVMDDDPILKVPGQ